MKRTVAIFLLLTSLSSVLLAQQVSRHYKDYPMAKVLTDLSHATERQRIIFIYNDLEDFTVTQQFDSLTIADAIRVCIGFYPISLTNRGDSILLVECIQKCPYKLIGRLVNEKGLPIANASITLFSTADSLLNKGISNLNGQFVIPCNQKEVVAKISHIAYKTVTRHCLAEDIGTIPLETANIRLANVSVTSTSPKHVESQYYKYATQIEQKVWGMNLPKFQINAIPTKYKDAPAVIIADYNHIEYQKKQQSEHLHRTRYFINNDNAALTLSCIPYSKQEDITDFLFHKLTVMGIRIVKPDGSIRLINTYPLFKPQIHTYLPLSDNMDTIRIEHLRKNDILDIFIYHHFKEIMSPCQFNIPKDYPILSYESKAISSKRINIQYREICQVAQKTVETNKNRHILTYQLYDFDGRNLNNQPSTTLYARMIRKGMSGPKNARTTGIIENPPIEQVLDDERYTSELAYQERIKSLKPEKESYTSLQGLSLREKADRLYATLAVKNKYNGKSRTPTMPYIYYATNFFEDFAHALTQTGIPFDYAMTTSSGHLPIDELLDVGDIIWFIRLKDGTCYFPRNGTPAGQIPHELKGRKAMLKGWKNSFYI